MAVVADPKRTGDGGHMELQSIRCDGVNDDDG
jgi:hypothetical protein